MCPRYKAIYSQQSFNFSRTDVSVLKKCTTVGYVFVYILLLSLATRASTLR